MREIVKIPPVPETPKDASKELAEFLTVMRHIIQIREGMIGSDNFDKLITWRDLVELGLITESQATK